MARSTDHLLDRNQTEPLQLIGQALRHAYALIDEDNDDLAALLPELGEVNFPTLPLPSAGILQNRQKSAAIYASKAGA